MNLIDKDALVAEIKKHLEYANNGILYAQTGIEKGLKKYERDLNAWQHCQSMCKNILSFIDTLEVKEVQEEPVSEEIGNYNHTAVLESLGYQSKGESVSEDCIYNRTLEERQKSCKFCSAACQVRIKEESVSEDLEEASKEWLRPQLDKSYAKYGEVKMMELTHFDGYAMIDAIEFGAKWQKENLWKPADGDDLPEIDREVIVLIQPYPLEGSEYAVYFAHRPNPDGWDGKNITTGEVEHYTSKTYDKGGWNIPNIVYWLDVKLPKEIEL